MDSHFSETAGNVVLIFPLFEWISPYPEQLSVGIKLQTGSGTVKYAP